MERSAAIIVALVDIRPRSQSVLDCHNVSSLCQFNHGWHLCVLRDSACSVTEWRYLRLSCRRSSSDSDFPQDNDVHSSFRNKAR
jgi:hypothetical protein